jgi:Sec-independent protein translocase protein TatA
MFGVDLVIILVVVLVVVLIWRGPKILPKWGETLGRGVKATKEEITELQDDLQKRDEATKSDGTKPDGTKPDGTKPDGTKPDGTPPPA